MEDVPFCPRRFESVSNSGLGAKSPSPDTWNTNRWNKSEWKWGNVPRYCSFCGGLHPEDVLRLLEEGWEIEPTDKRYKIYLHPPGHREHAQYLLDSIVYKVNSDSTVSEKTLEQLNYVNPFPCVKVYFQHFTDEQLAKYNEML